MTTVADARLLFSYYELLGSMFTVAGKFTTLVCMLFANKQHRRLRESLIRMTAINGFPAFLISDIFKLRFLQRS